MISSSELKTGMVIKIGGNLFKAIHAEYKAGTGKMGGVTFAKLKNLKTGSITDQRFHPDEKLEDIELEKKTMEFLYSDETTFYFMDPQTFEQIGVPRFIVGIASKFLQTGIKLPIEFNEGVPIDIILPPRVELKVISTASGLRETDATYKQATLEGGLETMVPQFIKVGDIVVIDTEEGKYLERGKEKGK